MQYHALINDEQSGPFSVEQLGAMWRSGAVTSDTLIWYDGLSEWIPLSSIEEDLQVSTPLNTPHYSTTSSHQNQSGDNSILKVVLGLAGATLLAFGVFCPLVSVPIVGQMNYFQNGQGDGIIILVLAGATALLCLIRRFALLWVTGLGSLGLLAFTFISFQSRLSTAKRSIEDDLADNPFAGLAAMAVQSVQIQWGIAVLAIGAILVVAAAAIPEKK